MPDRLLILENDQLDLARAAEVGQSIGLNLIDAYTTLSSARNQLDKGLAGEVSLPDIILLDLDLQHESGYDLLRYWRQNERLRKIPLLVWSGLGDHHKEICEVFKATGFVGKWEGKDALRQSLLDSLHAAGG